MLVIMTILLTTSVGRIQDVRLRVLNQILSSALPEKMAPVRRESILKCFILIINQVIQKTFQLRVNYNLLFTYFKNMYP